MCWDLRIPWQLLLAAHSQFCCPTGCPFSGWHPPLCLETHGCLGRGCWWRGCALLLDACLWVLPPHCSSSPSTRVGMMSNIPRSPPGSPSENTQCRACPRGSFSSSSSSTEPCRAHQNCTQLGKETNVPGNQYHDTLCTSCRMSGSNSTREPGEN